MVDNTNIIKEVANMRNINNIKISLKDRAAKMVKTLPPIMEGKDKGQMSEIMGMICTITDYAFLPDSKTGEVYPVFTVREKPGKFFFGGSVLCERLSTFESEGYHEDIVLEGLPVLFTPARSIKGNHTYTSVTFYPEG